MNSDDLYLTIDRAADFVWKDFSRFVTVASVEHGWLVLWGRWHDLGRRRELVGNRTYLDFDGVRRRVADSVLEMTGDPALVAEAMVRFNRTAFRRVPSRPTSDGFSGPAASSGHRS